MTPWLDDGDVRLYHGDCLDVMAAMDADSVDAIVCDPPYAIQFMGKEWDSFGRSREFAERTGHQNGGLLTHYGRGGTNADVDRFKRKANHEFQAWCEAWATEALRVLKPGGHLLAFGGTRTYHRLTCGLEDAGFEIRDCLAWLYGSGFPKSLDVSKAIDRAAGVEREVVGKGGRSEAAAWEGFGTALKPAHEPVVLARKPLAGTVAGNVLVYGTGALNIDGCRISTDDAYSDNTVTQGINTARTSYAPVGVRRTFEPSTAGRWPANVVLDEAAAAALDEQTGDLAAGAHTGAADTSSRASGWGFTGGRVGGRTETDRGGASRFFYTAKADAQERRGSKHPTVKRLDLMRWLVRLVTPPGGLVLDPFAGSGTTLEAARAEGFRAVGIEREAEYLPDIARRLQQLSLLGGAA